MEWWLVLIILLGGLLFLFFIGVPVAFAFMVINIIGFFIFGGGEPGIISLILSMYASVTKFILLPIPLFILMGEVMFLSGIAYNMMDTLDKWFGRLPGRLSLLAVGSGALFSTLSGASIASAAMLGSVLVPEMQKRGYKNEMTVGPIMAGGTLAMMIPPSALGVALAAIGQFSVGDFLIAIIIPGCILAIIKALYIVLRCAMRPDLAPAYELGKRASFSEKINLTLRYVFPLVFIVFLVVGVIFIGVATPTEAAALGAMGCFILCIIYGKLRWEIVKKSVGQAARVSVMMLMIFTGSSAFSEILAFTGATHGLVELAAHLPLAPIYLIISMLLVLVILGTFMESLTMIMVTIGIYMPIVHTLQINPIWFGTLMLLTIEMGQISPPFGLVLFVVKGVSPDNVTIGDVYRGSIPFLCCDFVLMILLLIFPTLTLWLPSLMG